jgi:DNA invertase Pin-like site-specific DNA recombinase
MPPIALYARVSTSEQNTEAQIHALRRYAQDRRTDAVEFVDAGVSGAKDSRPALDALMREVRMRRVSAVVVTKLDRLARSVHHLTSLAAELDAVGVALVVVEQALDTSTPAGRLLFHVLGSIAEFERSLILERVKAGQAAARRRGVRFGRPEVTDREDRARIVRLREHGRTLAEVAELVGVSRRTVARVLAEAKQERRQTSEAA